MTNNKATDEKLKIMLSETQAQITQRHALCNRGGSVEVDAYLFENMIMELQERRKAASLEEIYQCEFCHHDRNGDLQWHWEDVNKEFYDQYDVGRRGKRRVLYTAPPVPVLPEELLTTMEEVLRISDRDHEIWHKAKSAIAAGRIAMLNTDGK